jgi:hypothetical protein
MKLMCVDAACMLYNNEVCVCVCSMLCNNEVYVCGCSKVDVVECLLEAGATEQVVHVPQGRERES